MKMLAHQRRSVILDHVRRHGGMRISELTELLGVSGTTVRRDLEALADDGGIDRVHGGAVSATLTRGGPHW